MNSDPPTVRNDAALAAAILGLGLLLTFAGQSLLNQWQGDAARNQNLMFDHLLGFVVSASGMAVVVWWTLSFCLAVAAGALHRSGRRGGANALSKFSPSFMLRLAFALLSLNLMGINAAQAAVAPEPNWHPTSVGALSSPDAAWHASGDQYPRLLPVAFAPVPALDENHGPEHVEPGWRPSPPIADTGLLGRPGSRELAALTPAAGVAVKAGDSLWSIAASHLGPFATDVEVADSWPKWYAANTSVIGNDPAVLLPGQVLQPPPSG